jgi:hypothetical protein
LGDAGAKSVRERFSSEPGLDFVANRLRASQNERRAA